MSNVRLSKILHAGLEAIELVTQRERMVIVHGVGPRIAAFGARDRESLLFWDHAGEHTRGAWRLYGGHRMWLTRPGADESEETYAPDNAPCRVKRLPRGAGMSVTAPPTPAGIEKTLIVRPGPRAWQITHRLRNVSDMLWSGGAWALTCTLPARATRYRIPLGGGPARWDLVTIVIPRSWGGTHTSKLADPQFKLTEEALELHARGQEGKRMILAPRGQLEMMDPVRGGLVIAATYRAGQRYPLGTNLAAYLGPKRFMVELETLGPTITLAPGDAYEHVEQWTFVRKAP